MVSIDTLAFEAVLHWITRVMEFVGVAVIVAGTLLAAARSMRGLLSPGGPVYHQLRLGIGRAILLGLEILVAADIIGTIAVKPTLENVLILAVIVLIRTFLSISLTVEIEGRWPWQVERALKLRGPDAP